MPSPATQFGAATCLGAAVGWTRRWPRRWVGAALATTALLALCASLTAGPAAPSAHAVAKGLVDPRFVSPTSATERAAIIKQIGPQLGARWVRLIVVWNALEPTRGTYEPAEVQRLDDAVDGLRARGVKVILGTLYVPAWASDDYWWSHPPHSVPKGYQPFYPIREGALPDYARLGEFLATHFRGRVQALECGNEPNIWFFVYPQRTAADQYFAARVYLRMLRAFHTGVERADSSVKVIAGATAPLGYNDRLSTSPQRFAGFLAEQGAARSFDVYSHHPYTPGASINTAPDRPPDDPSNTVTLYNLGTLLRLFPGKPFYLTEYGYNTRPSLMYGWFAVNERTQARYLKRAYAYAGRYARVKVLLWYLVRDERPAESPADRGVYTGLQRVDGTRKPSWYAFANLGR